MTGSQLQRVIDSTGCKAPAIAKRLGLSLRQIRRYLADTAVIPRHVEIAVRCIAEHQDNEQ